MMYCQQCDSIVEELTATGICTCGNAIIDLTAIVEAANQRLIARVREWATTEREGYIQVSKLPDDMWVGSANGLEALLEFLKEIES